MTITAHGSNTRNSGVYYDNLLSDTSIYIDKEILISDYAM
jgi:hypothetical protein